MIRTKKITSEIADYAHRDTAEALYIVDYRKIDENCVAMKNILLNVVLSKTYRSKVFL